MKYANCSAVRTKKSFYAFDTKHYFAVTPHNRHAKYTDSIQHAKLHLNQTHAPLLFRYPVLPRTHLLTDDCVESPIQTPASDPYGYFEITQQTNAVQEDDDTLQFETAIVLGWNDDVLIRSIDGNTTQGGFIVHRANETATHHSLDYLNGKVSVDTETNACPNPSSFSSWVCFNSRYTILQEITQLVFNPAVLTPKFNHSTVCNDVTVEFTNSSRSDPYNMSLYDFAQYAIDSHFVLIPLCKSNNEWSEFDIVKEKGGVFRITMTTRDNGTTIVLKNVWKELLEEVFVQVVGEGDAPLRSGPRQVCGFSFIPYDVATKYTTLFPRKSVCFSFPSGFRAFLPLPAMG